MTRYSDIDPPPFYRRCVIAGVFDHTLRKFEKENDAIPERREKRGPDTIRIRYAGEVQDGAVTTRQVQRRHLAARPVRSRPQDCGSNPKTRSS